ncbi:MAG TPA: D-2-hydroxyacid dehydrogenase, partial [Pyrinomonadaceae bacterium]|nr:D-2-hydroxyacid dehydrogenase [Pyrinomonadaceae bacterium]
AGAGLAARRGGGNETAATPVEEHRLPLKITLRGRDLAPEKMKEITGLDPQISLEIAEGDAEWQRVLPETNVLFGSLTPPELARAAKLRWVQYGAAGVENILFPEFVNSPVMLTNAKGCYAPEIAEHVFGLLFGLTRGLAHQIRQMREARWGGGGGLIELRGMTMGIIGFGGIGRETARRARAMDMRVIAADVQALNPEQTGCLAEEIHPVDGGGLKRVLAASDVVVCAAPLTKRSAGMLGDEEFAAMKTGAYFINVSRGKLVKTNALLQALTSNKLAGAGLDVTDPEPLPADHALWKLPQVIISSHTAGQSQFAWPRTQDVFVENVLRYVNGLPLLNVVDKAAGF